MIDLILLSVIYSDYFVNFNKMLPQNMPEGKSGPVSRICSNN